jgi:hypothetical protein
MGQKQKQSAEREREQATGWIQMTCTLRPLVLVSIDIITSKYFDLSVSNNVHTDGKNLKF